MSISEINYFDVLYFALGILCRVGATLALLWYANALRRTTTSGLTAAFSAVALGATVAVTFYTTIEILMYSLVFWESLYLKIYDYYDTAYTVLNWTHIIGVICWMVASILFLVFALKLSRATPLTPSDGTSDAGT